MKQTRALTHRILDTTEINKNCKNAKNHTLQHKISVMTDNFKGKIKRFFKRTQQN